MAQFSNATALLYIGGIKSIARGVHVAASGEKSGIKNLIPFLMQFN